MFNLNIYTPNKIVGTFQVKHVQLPGAYGRIGVGVNHAPLISKIQSGVLSFETEQSEKYRYFVSTGVAHISKNNLDVLIESAEAPTDLDKERAKKAEERALNRLKNLTPNINIPRALSSLERARQRIMLAEQPDERSPS